MQVALQFHLVTGPERIAILLDVVVHPGTEGTANAVRRREPALPEQRLQFADPLLAVDAILVEIRRRGEAAGELVERVVADLLG